MSDRKDQRRAGDRVPTHIPGMGIWTGEIGAKGRISGILRRQSAEHRRRGVIAPRASRQPGLGIALAMTLVTMSAIACLVVYALIHLVRST